MIPTNKGGGVVDSGEESGLENSGFLQGLKEKEFMNIHVRCICSLKCVFQSEHFLHVQGG